MAHDLAHQRAGVGGGGAGGDVVAVVSARGAVGSMGGSLRSPAPAAAGAVLDARLRFVARCSSARRSGRAVVSSGAHLRARSRRGAWSGLAGGATRGGADLQLPSAIALNSLGFNIARAFGPALGGVAIALAGPGAAFLANAVSFLAVVSSPPLAPAAAATPGGALLGARCAPACATFPSRRACAPSWCARRSSSSAPARCGRSCRWWFVSDCAADPADTARWWRVSAVAQSSARRISSARAVWALTGSRWAAR